MTANGKNLPAESPHEHFMQALALYACVLIVYIVILWAQETYIREVEQLSLQQHTGFANKNHSGVHPGGLRPSIQAKF